MGDQEREPQQYEPHDLNERWIPCIYCNSILGSGGCCRCQAFLARPTAFVASSNVQERIRCRLQQVIAKQGRFRPQ